MSTSSGDYECQLLAELLPSCKDVADFFVNSNDKTAVEARSDTDSLTFYSSQLYEFCRLHAGLFTTNNGDVTVLGVGVTQVLQMLEGRTARPKGFTSLYPLSARLAWRNLEALRHRVREGRSSVEDLRKLLRLNTSSTKNREYILECLKNCNPEPPMLIERTRDQDAKTTRSSVSRSTLARVTSFATRCHQLLCENWACKCLPAGSHVAIKLLLSSCPYDKSAKALKFELLLSTYDTRFPWQETEIDVVIDPEPIPNEKEDVRLHVDDSKRQSHRVRFSAEAPDLSSRSRSRSPSLGPRTECSIITGICPFIRSNLGTRYRLLVQGSLMFQLKPAPPKLKNLKNLQHRSLAELIQNGYFRSISQRDRLLLSYIIARSILSIFQGPWLDRTWTKDRIFFLGQDDKLCLSSLRKPLLSAACVPVDLETNLNHPDEIHPEPRIAALGIVLVEIALGLSIESQRDERPINSNTDLLSASQLLDQMRQDPDHFPDHLSAIQTCLNPDPIFAEVLDAEGRQQSLYCDIVARLESTLTVYKIPAKDLDSRLGDDQDQSLHTPNVPIPMERPTLGTISRRSGISATSSYIESQSIMSFEASEASESSEPSEPSGSLSAKKWFQDLNSLVRPLIADTAIRRPRIAILDSGIDLPPEVGYAYEDRISYRSWIEGDQGNRADVLGHGTHAAGLLLDISPHAQICVARITEQGELDPDIIAGAIKYAVDEWKVDIITLSFGFPNIIPTIDKALEHALQNNTIMFAAASNSGNRQSIAWPARGDRVICIHSLNGDGDRSSYTPDSRPQDYGILGESVLSYWPPHFNAGDTVVRSGTSCAAPVAAGIAAIVLEYTEQRLLRYAREGSDVDEHVIQRLRSNAGIRKVFDLMVKERDGQNCIIPWLFLQRGRREDMMCELILEALRNL